MKHDNMRIYQKSLELIDVSRAVMNRLPVGYGFLTDQLRRSASSITLNFSEGYSKPSPREQRRFFNIAKASCYEVAAIFDVAQRFGFIETSVHEKGRDLCDHIAAMLSRFRP
jgi:four helix bundle protein